MPEKTTPEPFPIDLAVCSLNQLRRHAKRFAATHVVSLIEMSARVYRPSRVRPDNHLKLTFDDVEDPRHPYAPERRHIDSLLAFGRTLPEGARVIVHCQAGQCRSTAGALALLAQAGGLEHAQLAMDHITGHRPIVMPNLLVARHADDALAAEGRLLEIARRTAQAQFTRLFGRQRPSDDARG
ncbi:hypothetical protein CKO28_03115 [Rhodovibrio sodomensis]|uniref:Tyrosine specific protein phosphatases domain-containing protein n=1 Tax=Rhodovibrio sodomensis TaxID=1088 RepID=A0ABS1D9Y9_9PROT|nr:dual specificity protein phosphatase family protein [Rhodovibrio sodomensis]MBK1667034.1 hypothetical protein [Rhodovibrio sodomensis]